MDPLSSPTFDHLPPHHPYLRSWKSLPSFCLKIFLKNYVKYNRYCYQTVYHGSTLISVILDILFFTPSQPPRRWGLHWDLNCITEVIISLSTPKTRNSTLISVVFDYFYMLLPYYPFPRSATSTKTAPSMQKYLISLHDFLFLSK